MVKRILFSALVCTAMIFSFFVIVQDNESTNEVTSVSKKDSGNDDDDDDETGEGVTLLGFTVEEQEEQM